MANGSRSEAPRGSESDALRSWAAVVKDKGVIVLEKALTIVVREESDIQGDGMPT